MSPKKKQKRRMSFSQIVFIAIAVLVIASFILSLVTF